MSALEGEARVPKPLELLLTQNRLATFAQWPFTSDCLCTPERMAEAGFIHCPTENAPDVTQCIFCFKELEGWEPDDDPMEEHRKHSPNCIFLGLQKDISDLALQEILKIVKERMKHATKKQIAQKLTELESSAAKIRKAIQ